VNVIVGLGNPGAEYDGTRHNLGFRVVRALADRHRVELKAGRGEFLSGSGRIAGRAVELALPLTYMNLSGLAVRQLLESLRRTPSDLIVVCDDVNLPLGRLRLRSSGSDGGHNGLASIIAQLGSESFARLRLGVGGAPEGADLADYVLEPFARSEEPATEEMLSRAGDAVRLVLARGMSVAMQEYNRRPDEGVGDESV
jgi:PTH1 family peptidyl-tRNA hydrolase